MSPTELDSSWTESHDQPVQQLHLGDQRIDLAPGVSVADWALERVRLQNPRIRSLLISIRLLDSVLESNFTILHCSPQRLSEVWAKVRVVAERIRGELADLLRQPSVVPRLEEARRSSLDALGVLQNTLLAELEEFSLDIGEEEMLEARKQLCVSMGKIHGFLLDTFGRILAADPRSQHDADYFLSRRFAKDVEEAEDLYRVVGDLRGILERLSRNRGQAMGPLMEALWGQELVPSGAVFLEAVGFLERLERELVPRLKQVLTMPGIRFDEMEVLDAYTIDIPATCRTVIELGDSAHRAAEQIKKASGPGRVEREQTVRDLLAAHAVFSARLYRLLESLDGTLRDMGAFVQFWLTNIEKRRALMLKAVTGG